MMADQDKHIVSDSFLIKLFNILPLIEPNSTSLTFTLNHRSDEEVTMKTSRWLTVTHTLYSLFCGRRLFKMSPFTSEPKWI